MPQVLKKVFDKTIVTLIVALIVLNVLIIVSKYIYKEKVPKVFNYGMLVVVSGSMYPTISAGDAILIKKCNKYFLDDIVTYNKEGYLITHRIVKKQDETIYTKGDNNNVEDQPININDIEGKTIYIIKKIGIFIESVKSKQIIAVAIVASIIILTKENLNKQRGE